MRWLVVFVALLSACGPPPAAAPTPDPFQMVAEESRRAFEQGQTLYQQSRYREALEAFERARLLSPSADAEIVEMVARTSALLTPTPTAVLPTATPMPVTPTPAVALSSATPAAEQGRAYFGQVYMTLVPNRDTLPPPMLEFFHQDQIGLYVELLGQRLRMPMALRIFELELGRVIADVRSDVSAATPSATPVVSATPGPSASLVRFRDRFVWYHAGPEPPGRYRLELYAETVLTHVFEYVVTTTPVAIPSPVQTATVALEPTPQPSATPAPVAPPVPAPPAAAPAPPAPAPAPRPAPPPAAPTAIPAPGATSFVVDGVPVAVALVPGTNHVYVADAAGSIWLLEDSQSALKRPVTIAGRPSDIATDAEGARLLVGVESPPALLMFDTATGQALASMSLPVSPGAVRMAADLERAFVVLPDHAALMTIDLASFAPVQTVTELDLVTGISVDNGSVFVSHLGGAVSALDATSGQLTNRLSVSGVGLAAVDAADGYVWAINTPGHELLVFDPNIGRVDRVRLANEPSDVAVGERTGTVFVLAPDAAVVLAIDPRNGSIVNRVQLGAGSVRPGSLAPDELSQRPRLAVAASDEALFVIDPLSSTLTIAHR